jgi:hypothetical protein
MKHALLILFVCGTALAAPTLRLEDDAATATRTLISEDGDPAIEQDRWSSLSQRSGFVFGKIHGTGSTSATQHVLLWADGGLVLTTRPLQPDNLHFTADISEYTLPKTLSGLWWQNLATGELGATLSGGKFAAKLRLSEDEETIIISDLTEAPAGQIFAAPSVPPGGSSSPVAWPPTLGTAPASSGSGNGSSGTGSGSNTASSALATALSSAANLFFFSADPLENPALPLTSQSRSGDWTQESPLAQSYTDGSALTGLTSPQALPLVLAGHRLTNQLGASFSLVSLRPQVQGLPGSVTIAFSPPGGSYPTPSLSSEDAVPLMKVALQTTPSTATPRWRRLGSTQWQNYTTAGISVIDGESLEAQATQGAQSTPVVTATYAFTSPASTTPAAATDLNHNGLADAWEQAFGISDPQGDADGDGVSNLAEYRAATNPTDATSYPGSSILPGISIRMENGQAVVSWNGSAGTLVVETSSDMKTWTPHIVAPGTEEVAMPTQSVQRQFFRLRAEPSIAQ